MGGTFGCLEGVDFLSSASEGQVVASETRAGGTYATRKHVIVQFLKDSSSEVAEDLVTIEDEERNCSIRTGAEMLLSAFLRISNLHAERASDNRRAENFLSAVLPTCAGLCLTPTPILRYN